MIESFVDGRVRLRASIFSEKTISEALSVCLKSVEGVQKVDINMRTCGMLLEYDPLRISRALILKAAPLFEGMARLNDLPRPEQRKQAEVLLDQLRTILANR